MHTIVWKNTYASIFALVFEIIGRYFKNDQLYVSLCIRIFQT